MTIHPHNRRRSRPSTFRPLLESLEDRLAPAVGLTDAPAFAVGPSTTTQTNVAAQPVTGNPSSSQAAFQGPQGDTSGRAFTNDAQLFDFTNGPSDTILPSVFLNDPSLMPQGSAAAGNNFSVTPIIDLLGVQAQLQNNQTLTDVVADSSDAPPFFLLQSMKSPTTAQAASIPIGSLVPLLAANPSIGMQVLPTSLRSLTPTSTPDASFSSSPSLTRLQLLQPGENGTNASGHIGGTVSQDGFTRDGVAGVRVLLDFQQDDQFVPMSATATDAAGAYSFNHLRPGTYRVRVVVPDGREGGRDVEHIIHLRGPDQARGYDFRLRVSRSRNEEAGLAKPVETPPAEQSAPRPSRAALDRAFFLDWSGLDQPRRSPDTTERPTAIPAAPPADRGLVVQTSDEQTPDRRSDPSASETLAVAAVLLAQFELAPRGVDGREKNETRRKRSVEPNS